MHTYILILLIDHVYRGAKTPPPCLAETLIVKIRWGKMRESNVAFFTTENPLLLSLCDTATSQDS